MQLKIKIINQVFQTEKKSAKIEFDKMCKERKQYNIKGWSENGLYSLDILFVIFLNKNKDDYADKRRCLKL